ncbi:hypothetical protein CPC08DRAFT_142741 [Agrocybe pediades]|nr:hypothetical protein CPC08DRAFT_142741 [Agrocybe pediades]
MATMLETPSRIWRRIEAIEGQDMPSLPSLPAFEHSSEAEEETSNDRSRHDFDLDRYDEDLGSMPSPLQSTPTMTQHTMRPGPSSASSTARFANSIASRSTKSTNSSLRHLSGRRSLHNSFEVPSLPRIAPNFNAPDDTEEDMEEDSQSSVPEVYLPPEEDEDELSLTDALESVSRSGSPGFALHVSREQTPKKTFDYSVSLKSEPKASPFEKYRNVALRNRTNPRARTPSLSRTSSSQTTSPAHSTPPSNRSIALPRSRPGSPRLATNIPLPRSNSGSPAIVIHRPEEDHSIEAPDFGNETQDTGPRSMDITDVHESPPRMDGDADAHDQTEETEEVESRTDGQQQSRDGFTEGSQDGVEPTFSSEGEATPYAYNINNNANTTAQNATAFSSPSQSVAFTPTPAFPRPRARFDLPAPPSDLMTTPAATRNIDEEEEEEEHAQHEATPSDLLTPHTRRRSFLLDVINSTARPRMKFPTPHPKRFGTPGGSNEEATPGPGSGSSKESPATSLQVAFAGVTPRPRMVPARRASHPLSQAISADSPEGSVTGKPSPSPSPSAAVPSPANLSVKPWATPGARSSPYEGVGGASFISTASSHDLTTHQRANTSFDPAMGFGAGAPGHGVGRFNANKLNTYLHGLNRRLQEENEQLLERLRKVDEEKKSDPSTTGAAADTSRRVSAASRRASAVGTSLHNVEEDVAEGWLEEKAELEDMVEAFKIEVTNCMAEKEEVEQALAREQEEREKDKERWKERMTEVEQGVAEIVADLEKRLAAAEKQAKESESEASQRMRDLERVLEETQGERDLALERVSKAERLLENGKDLGGALKEANDRIGQIMGDLRNANAQIKDLEHEVMRSDARIDELEKASREDKDTIAGLEEELGSREDALAEERNRIQELENAVHDLDEQLTATKAYVDEMEDGAEHAVERLQELEAELAAAKETIQIMTTTEKQATQDLKALQNESIKTHETVRQMEEALEEAEQKMMEDEAALAELRARVSSLEREIQREASRDLSRGPTEAGPTEEEYQALEEALEEADKEIARLNTLLTQSPARKAMDKAKDTKIEMLEREKEELLERNRAMRLTFNEMATPSKMVNNSGISPIHRQVLNLSIRAPKTPGAPLKDVSFLSNPILGMCMPNRYFSYHGCIAR